LIVVGVIGFAVGGFRYTREKKDVVWVRCRSSTNRQDVPIADPEPVALIGGIGLVVGARS